MARQYFGTDGIRGLANHHPMTSEVALKVGMAAGKLFQNGSHRHRVVIGKDTRLSGYMLEAAIPWSDLLLVPQEGMMLGIALNVTDNDLLGESRQEVMLSHTPERTLLNPQSWGTLTLLGEKP